MSMIGKAGAAAASWRQGAGVQVSPGVVLGCMRARAGPSVPPLLVARTPRTCLWNPRSKRSARKGLDAHLLDLLRAEHAEDPPCQSCHSLFLQVRPRSPRRAEGPRPAIRPTPRPRMAPMALASAGAGAGAGAGCARGGRACRAGCAAARHILAQSHTEQSRVLAHSPPQTCAGSPALCTINQCRRCWRTPCRHAPRRATRCVGIPSPRRPPPPAVDAPPPCCRAGPGRVRVRGRQGGRPPGGHQRVFCSCRE